MKKTEEAMNKPGVMLYFDIAPSLNRLSYKEKGQLLEAILGYGQFGVEPELGGKAGLAWDFIKPYIDRDSERYEQTVRQRQYAVYVREAKKKGTEAVSFREWNNEKDLPVSDDIGRYPTTAPASAPTSTATPTTAATTAPTPTPTTAPTPSANTNTYIENKRESTKKQVSSELSLFIPPSAEEVREQCRKMGYRVDPVRFVDYYTANGWKIGSSAMQDWRAALKMWNGKEKNNGSYECSIPEAWTIGTVV